MKCSECGKVTKHYLSSKGEYRCLICGTVNKTVAPKKEMEVVFEADKELDDALNPDAVEETVVQEETTEEAIPQVEEEKNETSDLLSEI